MTLYEDIGHGFEEIRPWSSRTVEKHAMSLDPPGLTIASFVKHQDSLNVSLAFDRIRSIRPTFVPYANQLHITMLGVLDASQPALSLCQRNELTACLSGSIGSVANQYQPMCLHFRTIRPGIFRGAQRTSDGTMIWLVEHADERKVLDFSDQLHEILQPEVSRIHPDISLRRPFHGVWMTLGYFCDQDFLLDANMESLLESLKHQSTCVCLNDVALCEFRRKSLGDARVLDVFRYGSRKTCS